ncbi:MAG: LysR family transcriptional regulator [Candidatus Dormibacteraceae bacterium]
MQLHQLRYFLAAAREGTMTRAAETMFVSQPSLSEQIRKLEQELGGPLFQRLGRGLALTAVGVAFYEHAERALQELEGGRHDVEEVLGLRGGRVAVGVLPSVGAVLLPAVLAAFGRSYPGVDVSLVEENLSRTVEDLVGVGELDFAVVRRPLGRRDLAERLLIREPLLLLLPASHRLLEEEAPVDPRKIDGEPFVAFKAGYGLRDLQVGVAQRAAFEPSVVVETGQLDIARALVAAGVGVTILPRMAAGSGPSVRLRDAHAVRELVVVWRATSPFSVAARRFLELLQQEAERYRDPALEGGFASY